MEATLAKQAVISATEVSPAQKVLAFIKKNPISDYEEGHASSLRKIGRQISEKSTIEEIKKICKARRDDLFSRIDKRTTGDVMERKDEMTSRERGALQGVTAIEVVLEKKE